MAYWETNMVSPQSKPTYRVLRSSLEALHRSLIKSHAVWNPKEYVEYHLSQLTRTSSSLAFSRRSLKSGSLSNACTTSFRYLWYSMNSSWILSRTRVNQSCMCDCDSDTSHVDKPNLTLVLNRYLTKSSLISLSFSLDLSCVTGGA